MVRGPIVLVVAIAAMAVAAAAVLAPRSFDAILPVSMIERLERLRVPLAENQTAVAVSRTGEMPEDFLVDTPEGLLAEGPVAALTGNVPAFIADVVSGYSSEVAGAIPVEITTIRPIMGCLLTPPQDGTVVGHVVAGHSNLPLDLSTYNDTDLAGAVQSFADAYRQDVTAVPVAPEGLAYQSYDVVVTEVSAPVYLVLQTGEGNRIWNIHLAPGARIERVIALGGGQAGLANLDPVVPVEVILDNGLETCGIRPAHPLNPGHALNVAVQSGAAGAQARLTEHEAAVDAYGTWFRDTFGIQAAPSRAGFDRGTLSVVGPVPGPEEPLAVFAPVAGSKIRTTQDSFFEIAGQVAAGEDFAARVRAIATSFAFGDLATLRQGADF